MDYKVIHYGSELAMDCALKQCALLIKWIFNRLLTFREHGNATPVSWVHLRQIVFDDAGAIALIGQMKAGQRHPVAVCRFGSCFDLVHHTEPVSHNTTKPTISLHDLINGTRRRTPHRYIRATLVTFTCIGSSVTFHDPYGYQNIHWFGTTRH